jgi:integrase
LTYINDGWGNRLRPLLGHSQKGCASGKVTASRSTRAALPTCDTCGASGSNRRAVTPTPHTSRSRSPRARRGNLYIKKVKREHGGAAAALQKTLLSNLWAFARGFEDFDGGNRLNPMNNGEIETPYTVAQEHLPWPEEVQDEFLAACDENLYDGFHLLICTGQRVSDVAKMKREHFDGRHFELVQKKDRTKTPMKIKAPKVLRDVLAARAKRTGGNAEYLLTHKWGRPYSAESLSLRIPRCCAGSATPNTLPTGCARTPVSCWPRTARRCRRSWRRSATRRRRWRFILPPRQPEAACGSGGRHPRYRLRGTD